MRLPDHFRPLAEALADLALVGLLSGAGAAVLGYAALRVLQEWLGIPEVMPTLFSVAGALLGCRLAFRLLPAGRVESWIAEMRAGRRRRCGASGKPV